MEIKNIDRLYALKSVYFEREKRIRKREFVLRLGHEEKKMIWIYRKVKSTHDSKIYSENQNFKRSYTSYIKELKERLA